MPAPLFSIILPVYNAAPYLDAAIASLLGQDHAHFEIIAIDDGSTDASPEILEAHARRDPRLRVVSREHRGVVATRNEGLTLAGGDLVALMDADDISYPERLSKQAAAFETDPDLGLCGTAYDEIIGGRLVRNQNRQRLDQYDLSILSQFFTVFTHSTVVFNRNIIAEEDLVYDLNFPCAEDFELLRRLARKYRSGWIGTSLLAYRIHAGSISSRQKHQQQKQHLLLVAENLRRELCLDCLALEELGAAAVRGELSPELALRAADCLREIERVMEQASAEKQPSYRVGVRNLFDDICRVFRDQDPMLLRIFLDTAEKWHWLRPLDRLWLGAYRRSRLLGEAARKSAELADAGRRRLRSVPLATALPEMPARAGND